MEANDPLRLAAQALIDRWETPLWKDAPATAEFIHRLREALANPLLASIEWHRVSEGDLPEPRPERDLLVVTSDGHWYKGEFDGQWWIWLEGCLTLTRHDIVLWAELPQAPAQLSHEAQEREGAV